MLRGLVGHRRDDHDAALVRGVDRGLRLRRIRQRAERLLHHVRTDVEREQDARREATAVGDERVGDADRKHAAARARADVAGSVLARGRVLGLAGAVAVLDGVERIVVAVEEVPTRDVVDVAVAVVVLAVAVLRVEDEVLGIGDAVAVAIGDRAEVGDVEHAVAVAVAVRRRARRARLAEVDVRRGREVAPCDRRAAT